MTPKFRAEYIKRIEADLAQIRKDLEPLESGQMQLRERNGSGPWVDKTQEWIQHHKRTIATYEAILAALKKDASAG